MSIIPLSAHETRQSDPMILCRVHVTRMRAAEERGDLEAWERAFEALVAQRRVEQVPVRAQWRRLMVCGVEGEGSSAEHEGLESCREVLCAGLVARVLGCGGGEELSRVFGLGAVEMGLLAVVWLGRIDPGFTGRVDGAMAMGRVFGAEGPLWSLGRLKLHPMAPLRRFGLVEVESASGWTEPECGLSLADGVMLALDGHCVPDPSLVEVARWTPPSEAGPGAGHDRALLERLGHLVGAGSRARGVLVGTTSGEGEATVRALGTLLGRTVLTIEGARFGGMSVQAQRKAWVGAVREARLHGAVLHVELEGGEEEVLRAGLGVLSGFEDGFVVTATSAQAEWTEALPGRVLVELPGLSRGQRGEIWRAALGSAGIAIKASAVEAIAGRHPLGRRAIEAAVVEVQHRVVGGAEEGQAAAWLSEAAGRQAQRSLSVLAERVETTQTWSDIVLGQGTLESLMEVLTFARYRQQVFDDWGFRQKLPYGRSLSALMHGPPGTGKTMVAGIIARELDQELYRVDLSQIVSKYIGETEKHLARIFEEARRNQAVLLFDEADSLFGKRTEVKTSVDRYANMNVNYLLQAMESFEGVVLLTTNLEGSIDDAFKRRIRFHIELPFPDEALRAQLWEGLLPRATPRADAVDFKRLGREFEMSGGYIKDAVLRAAFMAAERGSAVDTELLYEAGRRVYREMGRLVFG